MNDERSFERTARAWLELGANQAQTAPSSPCCWPSKRHHRNGICASRGGSRE